MRNNWVGTFTLFKLACKRDWLQLLIWLLAIPFFTFLATIANGTLGAEEMQQVALVAIDNPGLRFMLAPIENNMLDHLGAFILFRMSSILVIVIAIMNQKLIIRHTRQNEETGRTELIASTVTGKKAPLGAAWLLGLMTNTILSIGLALALLANGLEWQGSLIAGLSYGLLGMVFIGIGGFFSEITSASRSAGSMSGLLLTLIFLINGGGNALEFGTHPLTYATPMGWVQQIRPFDENNLLPLAFLALMAFTLMMVTKSIITHRDVGTGLVAARQGRSDANKWYLTYFGFALKRQKSLMYGWFIFLMIFGLIFGASGQEYGETLRNNAMFKASLQGIQNSFFYMMIGVITMIVGFYVVQTLGRMRYEEIKGYSENILATPIQKTAYKLSHIFWGWLGTFLMMGVFITTLLVTSGIEDGHKDFIAYMVQNMSALLFLSGVGIWTYGRLPKYSSLISYGVLILFMLTGPFFGAILQLPERIQNLSPFTHFGFFYQSDQWLLAIALYSIGLLLSIVGLLQFRKRDLMLS